MALGRPDGRAMPAGAPFNGAMARVRELITRLRYAADQSALDDAARVRARELDADEYAARVNSAQPTSEAPVGVEPRELPRPPR